MPHLHLWPAANHVSLPFRKRTCAPARSIELFLLQSAKIPASLIPFAAGRTSALSKRKRGYSRDGRTSALSKRKKRSFSRSAGAQVQFVNGEETSGLQTRYGMSIAHAFLRSPFVIFDL